MCVILKAQMPHIVWFQLLSCENILLFFFLCDQNLTFLCSGLLVGHNKLFKNVNLKVFVTAVFHYFLIFLKPNF